MENKIHVPNHQSESIPFYNEYPCSISTAACQFRSPESHRLIVLQRVRVACRVHQGLRRHQRWQHPNERLFGFVTCSRASWAGDLTMISGLTQGTMRQRGNGWFLWQAMALENSHGNTNLRVKFLWDSYHGPQKYGVLKLEKTRPSSALVHVDRHHLWGSVGWES